MNDFVPYELKNGKVLVDEDQSKIMYKLKELKPHISMDFTWDDIGMATLMSTVYEDDVRYCPQDKSWYIWENRWKKQQDSGAISDRLQTLLNLLRLYADEVDASDYKKYISSLRKYTPMKNILEVLKSMVRLQMSDMDTNAYILNTTNGAYDLRTGELVENIRDYNITKITNTHKLNDLDTPCGRWYSFIDEIMSHDKDKAKFLQRALGYSLLGVNREECMFMAYGPKTRNGKGTLFHAIKKALSEDYADSSSTDLICQDGRGFAKDFNAPQPALAKIKAARIVDMSENSRDVMLAAAAMKSLTGRDTLVTRGLHENSFSFVPQFTMWLSTNYLPAVNDDSVFKSNRIWVIEFNESFTEDKRDLDLKEIFTAPENLPTVLSWLMDGCTDYLKNGLNPPECVRKSTEKYRTMYDRIGTFIKECCSLGADKKVLRGTLNAAYERWCRSSENRYSPISPHKFYADIALRGFPLRVVHGDYYFKGLDVSVSSPSKIPLS